MSSSLFLRCLVLLVLVIMIIATAGFVVGFNEAKPSSFVAEAASVPVEPDLMAYWNLGMLTLPVSFYTGDIDDPNQSTYFLKDNWSSSLYSVRFSVGVNVPTSIYDSVSGSTVSWYDEAYILAVSSGGYYGSWQPLSFSVEDGQSTWISSHWIEVNNPSGGYGRFAFFYRFTPRFNFGSIASYQYAPRIESFYVPDLYDPEDKSVLAFARRLICTDIKGGVFELLICTDFDGVLARPIVYLNDFNDNDLFNQGYGQGYADGYDRGYDLGDNAGFNRGKSFGYDIGYNAGYNAGVESSNEYTFMSLFSALIDAPVKVFLGLTDFEVFGIKVSSFVLALLTIGLAIAIVRKFMGG